MPTWTRETRVVDGVADHLDLSGVPLGPGKPRPVIFDQAEVTDATIALDDLHLGAAWSAFVDCSFHQRSRRIHPDGEEPQGSLGNRPSLYSHCLFRGVRLRVRGGFSVGEARFEDCVFDGCRFEEHFSFAADYVRCRFVGPMRTAVFYGTDPETGRRNQIVENDFREAAISSNVGWRGAFPLDAQVWPEGYEPVVNDR
jgi:hypothetical protein